MVFTDDNRKKANPQKNAADYKVTKFTVLSLLFCPQTHFAVQYIQW